MEQTEPVSVVTTDLPQNGKSRSTLLSSNWTLFYRVFVPVFGTVFLAGLTLALWFTDEADLYQSSTNMLISRLAVTSVLLGWAFWISRTLWRLKRVDGDDAYIYVTNYWQSVRYAWNDVERMEEKKRMGRRIVNFWLKGPGRFGQVISFLPGTAFDEWILENGKKELLLAN